MSRTHCSLFKMGSLLTLGGAAGCFLNNCSLRLEVVTDVSAAAFIVGVCIVVASIFD